MFLFIIILPIIFLGCLLCLARKNLKLGLEILVFLNNIDTKPKFANQRRKIDSIEFTAEICFGILICGNEWDLGQGCEILTKINANGKTSWKIISVSLE